MAEFSTLRATPQAIRGIKLMLDLDDDQVDYLAQIVSNEKPSASPWKFANRVSANIKNAEENAHKVDEAEAYQIALALVSISNARVVTNKPLEVFVESASKAVDSDGDKILHSPEQIELFKQRLGKFLGSCESVYLTAKSYSLVSQHQKIFEKSSIYTDIRPLFSENAEEHPKATVMFHNLKFDYYDETGPTEIYIVLSQSDLLELKETIARAELKISSASEWLNDHNVMQILPD